MKIQYFDNERYYILSEYSPGFGQHAIRLLKLQSERLGIKHISIREHWSHNFAIFESDVIAPTIPYIKVKYLYKDNELAKSAANIFNFNVPGPDEWNGTRLIPVEELDRIRYGRIFTTPFTSDNS